MRRAEDVKALELATLQLLQGMAAPVFDGKHACGRTRNKHRLAVQIKNTGAIFRNIGKRRDSNFHRFNVLE